MMITKRNLKLKRSQTKIQEMIFMIIAVAIFFILVLLFYLAVSLGGIKKTAEAGSRSSSILLVSALAGSSEFNCPHSVGSCVDTDKIINLMNHPEYAAFWGVAGLRVERVYPIMSPPVLCNSVNYPSCSVFTIVPSKSLDVIRDESYVSLCRRELKNDYPYIQCDLGKIVIETAKKT